MCCHGYHHHPVDYRVFVVSSHSVPDPPREVTIVESSPQSTTVNWLPPVHPRGDVHYQVEYSTDEDFTLSEKTSPSSATHSTLPLPEFPTSYIRVFAVNSEGEMTSDLTQTCPGRRKERSECCNACIRTSLQYVYNNCPVCTINTYLFINIVSCDIIVCLCGPNVCEVVVSHSNTDLLL